MKTTTKSLKYWQWRTIIVLMIGYALFYLVRKNFSIAMPALEKDLGISKTQLGIFLTLNGVIYGLSRFVNGIITDRGSARKVMSLGLILTAAVNIFFGCSDFVANWITSIAAKNGSALAFTTVLVYIMGTLWLINGFLQGMGVPPCTKTITQWIEPNELATKMSIWNMSHSIGAGIAMGLCGWLLVPHFGWRWCFIVPAIVAASGAAWLFVSVKDSPSDVGLPEVVGKKKAIVQSPEESADHKRFVRKHVYGSRVIWTLAITNFFVYVVRFSALDWGPTLLMESKGLTLAAATTLCVLFELVGGNLGMVVWGWATDHIFNSKAHHTCVFCMIGAALSIVAFYFVPANGPWVLLMLPYVLLGFFIYGPQALLGVCAANHATNRASATANGILGIFGYASTLVSGVGFGYVAQHYGWNAAYLIIFIMAVISILCLLTMWGAKANGYEEEPARQ